MYMGQNYLRIDDRLIHGQIVTAWCGTLGIGEIIAIDSGFAQNPMLQSIMTMGVPAQYHPHIVTAEEAKKLLRTDSAKNRLVITRFARSIAGLREFSPPLRTSIWATAPNSRMRLTPSPAARAAT